MTDQENHNGTTASSKDNLVDITPRIKQKNRPILQNYYWEQSQKGKDYRVGLDAHEIHQSLSDISGNWPRRIGNRIFIPPHGKIRWLDKPAQLFGWLSSEGVGIDWAEHSSGGVNKAEFVAALQGLATEHAGFSALPHFPPKAGYYYVPIDLPESSNGAFEKLLTFFAPATPIDADILRAAFLTLFWGGPPGTRPAFVFTGLDDDKGGGRGIGKTTLTDIMARLAGGAIDFSAKMTDIEQFKKRVLTSNGERVIRFDNVKSSRLSNGDIEGIITSPQISGHVMFHGNGVLSNDFTYLFTFNDVSFSKDMAQRAIPITLTRPEYSGNWDEDLAAFLKERQLEIIAGIREHFEREPIAATGGYLRFAQWTKEVLYRATSDLELVNKIKDLQDKVDDDDDTNEEINAIILYNLEKYKINHGGLYDNQDLFSTNVIVMVRRGLLNQWVMQGLGIKTSHRAISKMISRAHIPGFIEERIHDGTPYLVWSKDPENGVPRRGAYRIFDDWRSQRTVDKFVEFRG